MSPLVLLHGFTGSPAGFDGVIAAIAAEEPARSVPLPLAGGARGGSSGSVLASPPPTPPASGRGARAGAREDGRPIRPLLAGHGADPVRVESWEAEIDRLVALLRAELAAPAHLVGYSLGGRVAFGLLARAPELFARATLIGAHPGLEDASERAARRASDARWIALLERDGLDAFIEEWEALPLWATQSKAIVEAQRAIRRSHRAEGLAHALSVLGLGEMPPVDPRTITTPIALVVGELDAKHRALAETFAPRIDARVHVIPSAGHNVLAEAPEALAELLR